MSIEKLKYFSDGKWLESKTIKYMDCYNPSTGEVVAQTPCCTTEEVEDTIKAAHKAYLSWREVPPSERVQVLFRMKSLMDKHMDELSLLCATEHGKTLEESYGDVFKVREVVEFACGMPHLMKGSALMNVTRGYDTAQYYEPIGVFAGIAPWNFPAMIPMGWMAPICIATGNTMVNLLVSLLVHHFVLWNCGKKLVYLMVY